MAHSVSQHSPSPFSSPSPPSSGSGSTGRCDSVTASTISTQSPAGNTHAHRTCYTLFGLRHVIALCHTALCYLAWRLTWQRRVMTVGALYLVINSFKMNVLLFIYLVSGHIMSREHFVIIVAIHYHHVGVNSIITTHWRYIIPYVSIICSHNCVMMIGVDRYRGVEVR